VSARLAVRSRIARATFPGTGLDERAPRLWWTDHCFGILDLVRLPARTACATFVAVGVIAMAATLVARAGGTHQLSHDGRCRAQVHHDVLPVWMRGGFSGPNPRVPYVLGAKGQIGGVVFGWPLHSPPLPNRSNKILWVARHLAKSIAPLWIRLQPMQGDRALGAPIRKIIPTGPGPSIVDVPSAGCWRLSFNWSGRHDTLDLEYTPPS
jgi:hypothetical protein